MGRALSLQGLDTPDTFLHDVARGVVPGATPFGAYGEVTTAGAASGVLWPDGAYAFPAAAGVQMSLVSTSANDTSAGTGIKTVAIHYLDANLAEQTEVVTLNGVTPVLTVATNIRFIQCMHGVTFGSGAAAAGDISASNGGQTYSFIATGASRCSSSVRMVPAGKRLLVPSQYAGSRSATGSAESSVYISSPQLYGYDLTTSNIFFPLFSATFQDNSNGLTVPCPLAFTEGQSLGMTYKTTKAATIAGSWFGWLEDAE